MRLSPSFLFFPKISPIDPAILLHRYSFRNNEGQDEDATALLQDAEDRIWSELKHMHMGEALEKVTTEFKKYVEEHGGSAK